MCVIICQHYKNNGTNNLVYYVYFVYDLYTLRIVYTKIILYIYINYFLLFITKFIVGN